MQEVALRRICVLERLAPHARGFYERSGLRRGGACRLLTAGARVCVWFFVTDATKRLASTLEPRETRRHQTRCCRKGLQAGLDRSAPCRRPFGQLDDAVGCITLGSASLLGHVLSVELLESGAVIPVEHGHPATEPVSGAPSQNFRLHPEAAGARGPSAGPRRCVPGRPRRAPPRPGTGGRGVRAGARGTARRRSPGP
jgi:hypothetical protein